MYSAAQVLFFLLFFLLTFLLLVFGETTIGIVLLGLLTALCMSVQGKLHESHRQKTHLAVGSLALFVVVTVASLTQTISLPLTVNAAMFYASSFVAFFCVLRAHQKWIDSTIFLGGMTILASIFVLLTLVFTFFPTLSHSLPTTSLLTALYGHNQASVLFLLVIPVAWYFAERLQRPITYVALGLLFVGVIFSFARVALLLTLLEVAVLTVTTQSKSLKKVGIVAGVITAGAVLFFALGSLSFLKNSWCFVPMWQDKLCKSVHMELRPAYWSQAVRAGVERPLLGWGGGTFSLLSPRYQLDAAEYSGYAHSELLQAFAEYGVLGGALFFIFLFAVFGAALQGLRSEDALQQRLSLALLAVLVSSFFDFSLHMVGIWISFLAVVAILLRHQTKCLFCVPSFGSVAVRATAVVSGFVVCVWSACFLLSEVVWPHSPALSVKLFPFAYWKVDVVLKEPRTFSPGLSEWITELYAAHYRTWDVLASSEHSSSQQRADYLLRAITLDPFGQTRYLSYVTAAIESGDYQQIDHALKLWEQQSLVGMLDMYSYQTHGEVALMAIEAANVFFRDGKVAEAFTLYVHAAKIQPSQLLAKDLVGIRDIQNVPLPISIPFLQSMSYDTIFPYERVLYDYQAKQLRAAIQRNDEASAVILLNGLLKLGDDKNWNVAAVIVDAWKETQQFPGLFTTLIAQWETQSGEGARFDYAIKSQITKKSGVSAGTY